VNQLINDIITFKHKPAYRLVQKLSFIMMKRPLNIAEQQRTTLLLLQAILARLMLNK
jgi:hypothetical protein